MAFVVEDGTGLANATSYVDVAFVRAFELDRGRTGLAAVPDQVVQALLIRATDYAEARWRALFKGAVASTAQALSWPRTDATDESNRSLTGVPNILQRAIAELAERAEGLDRLISDPPPPYRVTMSDGSGSTMTTGDVQSQTDKVGPITRTRIFSMTTGTTTGTSSSSSNQVVVGQMLAGVTVQAFPGVDLLVEPLLRITSSSLAGGTQFVRN